MADALKAKGAPIEMVIEKGKDHLYDRDEKEQMTSMYEFIAKHAK